MILKNGRLPENPESQCKYQAYSPDNYGTKGRLYRTKIIIMIDIIPDTISIMD
jgi:hypothetical protein